MKCGYCHFSNTEDEHRCRRCGRRLTGRAHVSQRYAGANALAPDASQQIEAATARPVAASPQSPAQSSLFVEEPAAAASNVIPFDAMQREARNLTAPSPVRTQKSAATKATVGRRTTPHADDRQSSLEFLPAAPQAARTLKTTVEAVIFCDAPVAAPMHRFVAGALDASMIVIAFGILLGLFGAFGGAFTWNHLNQALFSGAFAGIAFFYGVIWALAGRETPGMRWTQLRLISFDGFPPDAKSRTLRMLGCWLSFCSGAIGLLWAVVDEENLTWHDHMSKTFPTLRESSSILVRQR